jgi:hypothetical protein
MPDAQQGESERPMNQLERDRANRRPQPVVPPPTEAEVTDRFVVDRFASEVPDARYGRCRVNVAEPVVELIRMPSGRVYHKTTYTRCGRHNYVAYGPAVKRCDQHLLRPDELIRAIDN